MSFEVATGVQVASGDAILIHDGLTLEADLIRFDKNAGSATASGNVRVTRPGLRLVTQELTYNVTDGTFFCGAFRAGYPPAYFEGEAASGTMDSVDLTNVTAYVGEPDSSSPSVRAERMSLSPDKRVLAVGARPGIGKVTLFRVPEVSGSFEELPDIRMSGNVGYDGHLGAFVSSQSRFPVTEGLSLGANLDIYSRRGLLVGPTAAYNFDKGWAELEGTIDSGWIRDQGTLGYDYLGQEVPGDRWFVMARHRQMIEDTVSIVSSINLLSDPDMLRDFRPEVFDADEYPDNFVEVTVPVGDDVVVSALTRFSSFGDKYFTVQRLPELRADLFTSPLPFAGLYHKGFVSYARNKVDILEADLEEERLYAFYGLARPLHLARWLTVTPRIGTLYSWHDNGLDTKTMDDSGSFNYLITECGLDVEAAFHAQWNLDRARWKVDGLRHVMRPVLRARDYSAHGDTDSRAIGFESMRYSVQMPTMDLSELWGDDSLYRREPQIIRAGIENSLLTRDGASSRELANLNMYFDRTKKSEYDDAAYVQLGVKPLECLDFGIETGMDESLTTINWYRLRLGLKSADQWTLRLYADYCKDYFEDYVASVQYELTRNYACVLGLGFDAVDSELDRASFTLIQRIGSFWRIRYRLSYNKDDLRRDSVSASLAIATMEF
jgi:LPS-assembly protein